MKTMSGGRQWVYLVVFFIGAVLAASASSASATGTVGEVARGGSDGDSSASYDGRQIDLKRSWEGAGLEAFVAKLTSSASALTLSPTSGSQSAAGSSCSSYVKLYDGTSYTGSSLWLSTRWSWINLSTYGFNQRASSFKIGACSAHFADYSNGGGAWYPTWATQAYDVASTMASGWNNDVSSVYIT